MSTTYSLDSSVGTFTMQADDAGAWRVYLADEELGAYRSPEEAASELATGGTCWPSADIDPGTLGLPATLAAWKREETTT